MWTFATSGKYGIMEKCKLLTCEIFTFTALCCLYSLDYTLKVCVGQIKSECEAALTPAPLEIDPNRRVLTTERR